MSEKNSLYITLQYIRTVDGEHEYHWALCATNSKAPEGYLLHATNKGRQPLDLYLGMRAVNSLTKVNRMIVALKIAHAPDVQDLKALAQRVPLMDKQSLPENESQWTSRVWVKEMLNLLHEQGKIILPADTDTLEFHCKSMADAYLKEEDSPIILNDYKWPSDHEMALHDVLSDYYDTSPMQTGGYQPASYDSTPATTQAQTSRSYGHRTMSTEVYY